MDVPGYVWLLTVVGIVGMLVFDFVFHVRRRIRDERELSPSMRKNSSTAPTPKEQRVAAGLRLG